MADLVQRLVLADQTVIPKLYKDVGDNYADAVQLVDRSRRGH